jgi:hypothetical protein
MGALTDALKAQLIQQTQERLFILAKEVAAEAGSAGGLVASLLQNDGNLQAIPDDEIGQVQTKVEEILGKSLDTLTEILTLAAGLRRGNLPS